MNEKNTTNKFWFIPIVYYICLFVVWAAYTLLLKPIICDILGDESFISSFLRSGIIKNLIWTMPAALLIMKFRKNCMISLKDMFIKISPNWKGYLMLFLFFSLFVLIGAFRRYGGIYISESFGMDDIITVVFVGLTEELVFRGWLLNSTVKESLTSKQEYIAVAVNAVMFLCIHFPIWISKGEFIYSFTSLGFLSILVLSVIFSVTFIKTKNILLPIALHMFWDLMVFMFG
ncbi:MAG: CPBP family intramembrane metalloprotease [Ruminococcus sp.]|nr:CPBP family intramembrane metalloprotease [Ruminococcus sp.]